MPTKKTTKKTEDTPEKATVAKKNKCADRCTCKRCGCGGHSPVPVFVLVGMLVASLVVLVVSVCFNMSVRDIFRPSTYIYNGKFDAAVRENKQDESGITLLSAGAAIDMIKNGKSGLLIVGEENDISSDAFSRRVASLLDNFDGVYRYNVKAEEDSDDIRVENIIGAYESRPTFVYVKGGAVYDRIDDVKDADDLALFLEKYLSTED